MRQCSSNIKCQLSHVMCPVSPITCHSSSVNWLLLLRPSSLDAQRTPPYILDSGFWILEILERACWIVISLTGKTKIVAFFHQGKKGETIIFLELWSFTKGTTKHQTWPQIGKNGMIRPSFAQRDKKALNLGRRPMQELKVGLHSKFCFSSVQSLFSISMHCTAGAWYRESEAGEVAY